MWVLCDIVDCGVCARLKVGNVDSSTRSMICRTKTVACFGVKVVYGCNVWILHLEKFKWKK